MKKEITIIIIDISIVMLGTILGIVTVISLILIITLKYSYDNPCFTKKPRFRDPHPFLVTLGLTSGVTGI